METFSRYAKKIPTKDHGHNPENIKKFNRQEDNNAIVNSASDKILMKESKKVSSYIEAQENIESDFYETELYHIENMSFEDKK